VPRNLDLTALRSFAAVAETGGVTRAAGFLNLTQSAVSMQIKRLEESLDLKLLNRSGRGVVLTGAGEQLLGYAQRMLALNDEVFARLTHQAYEGEITLGVPHDIVYPAIPQVLQRFKADYPRMNVRLVSSFTLGLRKMFERGECDMILTTEDTLEYGGETLIELPLIWIGAPDGDIWKTRPLRLAYEHTCIFRAGVQRKLDQAGIPWEVVVESDSTRTIEASVSANLAVHTLLEGMEPPYMAQIDHNSALPELTTKQINLYVSELGEGQAINDLVDLLRQAYQNL